MSAKHGSHPESRGPSRPGPIPGPELGGCPAQQDSGRVLIHLDEALMQADSSDCGQAGDCLKDKVTHWTS